MVERFIPFPARVVFLFSVVWQPGNHEVVERLVVKRGLCIIRGVPGSRPRRAHLEHGKTQAGTFERCRAFSIVLVRKRFLVHPSAWPQKDQIILHEVHKVFAMDSLASSHPLSRGEEEVNTPAQISGMFNSISYSKVCFSNSVPYLIT